MAIKAPGPYPPVRVQGKNAVYAEMMLGNIGGANSELSAVAHYRYNHVIALGENPALAELCHKISMVEMQHLDTFAQLAKLLGADPRFWQSCGSKKKYWTPEYVDYSFGSPRDMLRKLVEEERNAIRKYAAQANCIKDPYVAAVLRRVIQDEEEHAKTWVEELARL